MRESRTRATTSMKTRSTPLPSRPPCLFPHSYVTPVGPEGPRTDLKDLGLEGAGRVDSVKTGSRYQPPTPDPARLSVPTPPWTGPPVRPVRLQTVVPYIYSPPHTPRPRRLDLPTVGRGTKKRVRFEPRREGDRDGGDTGDNLLSRGVLPFFLQIPPQGPTTERLLTTSM